MTWLDEPIGKALATRGKNLDDAGRALRLEDLQSPCTEEVAVFHAFSHLVSQAGRSFVIMDTAPTGHSLLLMDAAGAYHRRWLRPRAFLSAASCQGCLPQAYQASLPAPGASACPPATAL